MNKNMRVLILGGDGYLGWPTAMDFAAAGHDVMVADNYMRRQIAEATESAPLISAPSLSERTSIFESVSGKSIKVRIGDLTDPEVMFDLVKEMQPDTIIHYAEQPSAPYSMRGFREARETFQNNLDVTFNCIWAVKDYAPQAHIVKLGTMGEYGTPNIDIEEGWLDIEHKGRKDTFLYPRAAGSLYHTTKVLDTDLIWFYVRTHKLRVTDLMQGPVYGLSTKEADLDKRLCPNFHYDDIFGTVVNRFLVQAVAGVPLTVYGGGGQTRGYLDLRDTLQCVRLAAENPAQPGELKIFNQLTETFTVNELAERVMLAGNHFGLNVKIKSIPNPRKEKEEHYYNPTHRGLLDLGLKPHYMTEEVLCKMLERIVENRDRIVLDQIMPRVSWS
ncbi:NAD-dependent epimerase/dehydratase family protein [Planktomarina temperata]|nr:NAD-dependent epimerase/dehydratase family protein [Planktomarina temperata]